MAPVAHLLNGPFLPCSSPHCSLDTSKPGTPHPSGHPLHPSMHGGLARHPTCPFVLVLLPFLTRLCGYNPGLSSDASRTPSMVSEMSVGGTDALGGTRDALAPSGACRREAVRRRAMWTKSTSARRVTADGGLQRANQRKAGATWGVPGEPQAEWDQQDMKRGDSSLLVVGGRGPAGRGKQPEQ